LKITCKKKQDEDNTTRQDIHSLHRSMRQGGWKAW
jgi:hypothetical protein